MNAFIFTLKMSTNFSQLQNVNKERDIYVLSKEYLEKCFGWQSPTRDSGLPKQLGCTGSCWHSDMVQVHNPVGVHQIFNLGAKITRTQD